MNNVCNDPILKTFSLSTCIIKDPYKKSKDAVTWTVVLRFSARRKVFLEFPDMNKAIEWSDAQKKEVAYYEVTISNQGGDVVETLYFPHRTDAIEFTKSHKQDQLLSVDKNQISQIDNEEGFLSKYVKESKTQDEFHNLMMKAGQTDVDMPDADLEVESRRREIRTELDNYHAAMVIKARALLLSIAKFYLKNREVSEEEYTRYKLKTEEEGLASNLWQLEVARKSIYRAYEEIQMGKANPKMFEAMVAMQRLVFDMNKYQHEYLNNLETTLKTLREDLETADMEAREANTENVTWTDGEVKQIIRGKKELINELEKFRLKSGETKIPMSANPKLHDKDSRLGDIAIINLDDGLKTDENDVGFQGDGFSSYTEKNGGTK